MHTKRVIKPCKLARGLVDRLRREHVDAPFQDVLTDALIPLCDIDRGPASYKYVQQMSVRIGNESMTDIPVLCGEIVVFLDATRAASTIVAIFIEGGFNGWQRVLARDTEVRDRLALRVSATLPPVALFWLGCPAPQWIEAELARSPARRNIRREFGELRRRGTLKGDIPTLDTFYSAHDGRIPDAVPYSLYNFFVGGDDTPVNINDVIRALVGARDANAARAGFINDLRACVGPAYESIRLAHHI